MSGEYLTPLEKIFEALDGPYGDNATLYANTKAIVDAAKFPTFEEFANAFIDNFAQLCADLDLEPPHHELVIKLAAATAGL